MADAPTREPGTTSSGLRGRPGGKGMLWGLIAVVIAFFIGFFWQFYQATTVRRTLSEVERELVVERLRVQLANAAIAAQAGRYEEARLEMSRFFTRIADQQWALPDPLRAVSNEFIAMRDSVITGLSRANPEFADVLFGMLDRFEQAVPARVDAPPPATGPPGPGAEPTPDP